MTAARIHRFPSRLEEYLGEENPRQAIDDFVDKPDPS
jgi:hypothetical protein